MSYSWVVKLKGHIWFEPEDSIQTFIKVPTRQLKHTTMSTRNSNINFQPSEIIMEDFIKISIDREITLNGKCYYKGTWDINYKESERSRVINSLCQENLKSYRNETVFEESLVRWEEPATHVSKEYSDVWEGTDSPTFPKTDICRKERPETGCGVWAKAKTQWPKFKYVWKYATANNGKLWREHLVLPVLMKDGPICVRMSILKAEEVLIGVRRIGGQTN